MRIAILGPVSAGPLAAQLLGNDRAVAEKDVASYGPAPTALARGLAMSGHNVLVVTHRRGENALELAGENLLYKRVESRSSRRAQALDGWRAERMLMRREIEAWQPEIIHAHWTYEWALAALESPVPVLVTVRDAPLTVLGYHRDLYRFLRTVLAVRVRLAGRNSCFAAVSPYMASSWKRQMRWTKDMPILPNMKPADVLRAEIPKSATPLIVEIADSGRRKNVKGLLRAFRRVVNVLPDARLELIGPGLEEGGETWSWARSVGADRGVNFLGVLDRHEVLLHLERAWVHAHAALEESFGNTLVESMSLGTPVIGGQSSAAVPWVLGNGEAGLLTDVRSEIEFSKTILRLLADDQLRRELFEAGLRRVSEVFSEESIVRAHIAVYESLIGGV